MKTRFPLSGRAFVGGAAVVVRSLQGGSTALAFQVRPSFDGKVALFGSLHNHSALSDDTVAADRLMPPVMGWKYAQAHGLDFLAIADHNKAADVTTNPLRLSDAKYTHDILNATQTYKQRVGRGGMGSQDPFVPISFTRPH